MNHKVEERLFCLKVYGVEPGAPLPPIRDQDYLRALGDYPGFHFVGEVWDRYRYVFEMKRNGFTLTRNGEWIRGNSNW